MSDDASMRGARRALSPKAVELGRGFLSALFMGLRTAQIHDTGNKAFERAVHNVRNAAEALYAATGGFSVNFVDESAFLNGVRLRFDGTSYDAMVTLRHILEQKDLGGIEMRSPPSFDAVRKLILLFSSSATEVVSKDDLLALQIGVLGVQRFADRAEQGKLNIDRRVFAVHCYAKLMLAFREQFAQDDARPKLRAVRIVQDVVELSGDRLDFLLRLGTNRRGAPLDEMHAANVCVLSIAIGRALGLGRGDLVDLGVAALLHDVGRTRAEDPAEMVPLSDATAPNELPPVDEEIVEDPDPTDSMDLPWFGDNTQKTMMRLAPGRPAHPEEMLEGEHPHAGVSLARLLAAAGLGPGGLMRSLTAAEHHLTSDDRFLYSRIVAVTDAYDALCSGLGTPDGAQYDTLEALNTLFQDPSGRIDLDVLDLLINVLRAFPVGVEVILDSGERGVVATHEGSTRWDRPVVHATAPKTRTVDLMIRDGDRFLARIVGTARFLGASS